ncbi:uncharacterized protein LOC125588560 [Brassica napus]|nr:uncharacterized protein LOC125588560 [Brassica napus]
MKVACSSSGGETMDPVPCAFSPFRLGHVLNLYYGTETRPHRKFLTKKIVGLYPEGSPSRNSRRPKTSLGPGGGLEIVFNQQ